LHYVDFDRVHGLALDNTRVVGASRNGEVKVWELVSGELLTTLHVSKLGAAHPVISPDGGLLVVTAGGPLHDGPSTTQVWRLPTGEPVTTITSPQVSALTFTGDGLIACACGGSLRLWHAETGEPAGTLDGDQEFVWEVSARGNLLVAGGFDRTLRIWDVHTNETLAVRKQDERVVHVATTDTMAVTGNLQGFVTWYELPATASATVQARYNRGVESLAVTPETTVSGHEDGKAVIWRSALRRAATADEPRRSDLYALETRAPRATGAERAWIDLVLALAKRQA
jgi:WD40 repeat protein